MAHSSVKKAPGVGASFVSGFHRITMPNPIFLKRGNAHTLKRQSQVLRVVSGKAWITFDAQDLILLSGEEITLTPGRDMVVISALGDQTLVYEIY